MEGKLNPYSITKIEVENIRSINNAIVEVDNPTGILRIGGRNGQGKSTCFNIGMGVLMGFVPAKPQLRKGTQRGFYKVTNSLGEYTVFVYERGKTMFGYKLIDGTEGKSDESVNHNKTLDVIRAYLGFDYDLDERTTLNLNEGNNLKFVTTNGRTELNFMKELVYSEEIEEVIERAKRDSDNASNLLDQTSREYSFANRDLFEIKTLEENYLDELINFTEGIIDVYEGTLEVENKVIKVKDNYNKINEMELEGLILRIQKGKLIAKEYTSLREQTNSLEVDIISLEINERLSTKEIRKTLNKITELELKLKSCHLENIIETLNKLTIKNHQKESLKVTTRILELEINKCYIDVNEGTIDNLISNKERDVLLRLDTKILDSKVNIIRINDILSEIEKIKDKAIEFKSLELNQEILELETKRKQSYRVERVLENIEMRFEILNPLKLDSKITKLKFKKLQCVMIENITNNITYKYSKYDSLCKNKEILELENISIKSQEALSVLNELLNRFTEHETIKISGKITEFDIDKSRIKAALKRIESISEKYNKHKFLEIDTRILELELIQVQSSRTSKALKGIISKFTNHKSLEISNKIGKIKDAKLRFEEYEIKIRKRQATHLSILDHSHTLVKGVLSNLKTNQKVLYLEKCERLNLKLEVLLTCGDEILDTKEHIKELKLREIELMQEEGRCILCNSEIKEEETHC